MTAALEGGEWSAAHPGRTLPPEKARYPFYRRLYIYIYIYIHTHTHTHIYMYVCVCINTHTYTYIYHTHTHTHVSVCSQYLWAQQRRWFRYQADSNRIRSSVCSTEIWYAVFPSACSRSSKRYLFCVYPQKSCSLKKDSFWISECPVLRQKHLAVCEMK